MLRPNTISGDGLFCSDPTGKKEEIHGHETDRDWLLSGWSSIAPNRPITRERGIRHQCTNTMHAYGTM